MFRLYTLINGRKHYYPADNGEAWKGSEESAKRLQWHYAKQLANWEIEKVEEENANL